MPECDGGDDDEEEEERRRIGCEGQTKYYRADNCKGARVDGRGGSMTKDS